MINNFLNEDLGLIGKRIRIKKEKRRNQKVCHLKFIQKIYYLHKRKVLKVNEVFCVQIKIKFFN